jgi:Peptidase family M48
MRSLKCLLLALAFSAIPLSATTQQPTTLSEVEDRIFSQEQLEVRLLRQYSPLVETYIQYVRPDKQLGEVPDGDRYFLGRAELASGVQLEPLSRNAGMKQKVFGGLGEFFSMEFLPRGFLQMIYLDMDGFDRRHYTIEYVGREFLGEVRCLVFDVTPLLRAGKGRFVGRIWAEDHDYHIVRFNGTYGGSSLTSNYLNFESWRMNVGTNLWLPAYVYSEGPSVQDAKARNLGFKAFRAQTRLWGYDQDHVQKEQELSKVFVEMPTSGRDQSETANDYSPLQAERLWDRKAEENVTDHLERQGLLAPSGVVDKVLETVVNNLEVTNNLDIQPEVRCRVLMTSTLESFTIGHTIVLSRGLIDVLPDETSLAAILAHELGHVVLRHRIDTQFAFFSNLRFNEKKTFRHFDFARTAEEEQAASQKGIELLKNSPYEGQPNTVLVFFQTLKHRSKEIPNLVSPHLSRAEKSQTSGAEQS